MKTRKARIGKYLGLLICATVVVFADCWDEFMARNRQEQAIFNTTSRTIEEYFDRMRTAHEVDLNNGTKTPSEFETAMQYLQTVRNSGHRANYERYTRAIAASYEEYINCPDDVIS